MMAAAPSLVLDTNVFLELYSIHDVLRAQLGPEEQRRYRFRRAQGSLLLACFCDSQKLTTISLRHEPLEQLVKAAPPENDSWEMAHTTLFIHFVREYVLPGWTAAFLDEPDDTGASGEQRDEMLLKTAVELGLPLITNEGYAPDGIASRRKDRSQNLRGKALDAGVSVFVPAEYCATHDVDEYRAAFTFLRRFDEHRATYTTGRENLAPALDELRRYYHYLFCGEPTSESWQSG